MDRHLFIGLDIGRYTIFASIVNDQGEEIDHFSIEQSHAGYAQLIVKINQLEAEGFSPVVASEGHDGNIAPLDGYLLDEGIVFKPLHPIAVSRYKEILGQPQKSDAYDAFVIASLLREVHHKIPEKVSVAHASELKALSRTYKALSKTKTRFTNQLQAELMSYFPELLGHKVFSTITGSAALNLLVTYPTPQQLAALSVETLSQFLAKHSKGHIGIETAQQLIELAKAVNRTPNLVDSKAVIVSSLASTLLALIDSQKQIKKQMQQLAEESQPLQRLMSVPGISVILAARFLGEITSFSRFATESKLAMFVGIAPIADSSGQRYRHKTTHRVNKVAKDTMMQIALCNSRVSPLSKAYYQKKRKAGKSHWQAIKCLARQLSRVIFALFREQTFYQHQPT